MPAAFDTIGCRKWPWIIFVLGANRVRKMQPKRDLFGVRNPGFLGTKCEMNSNEAEFGDTKRHLPKAIAGGAASHKIQRMGISKADSN